MARWRALPARSILDELPPRLHRSASPERCLCSYCSPDVSDRFAVECVIEAWRAERLAWCAEHGYSVLELLRAERKARREAARNGKDDHV